MRRNLVFSEMTFLCMGSVRSPLAVSSFRNIRLGVWTSSVDTHEGTLMNEEANFDESMIRTSPIYKFCFRV